MTRSRPPLPGADAEIQIRGRGMLRLEQAARIAGQPGARGDDGVADQRIRRRFVLLQLRERGR